MCPTVDTSTVSVNLRYISIVSFQISSREGYVPETAVIGTTVRVSPNPQAESLQILVSDEDLRPGMPPATYQYILTGPGATIFAVDQRGYLYLNVPSIDADPPNPSSYRLNVSAIRILSPEPRGSTWSMCLGTSSRSRHNANKEQ
ncbi:hypothetical protein ANCDUO_08534 [Ancylostoma duodenale]|uniref:Cadherin domain-containing protein n=1 Tax=Ancylostoma duodenale TaxID=51022 RepID=A0A0C2DFF6_9BILA|nr:hypothetical protein ANCDUO_08534 [Ancylostoma duodenale]